MPQLYVQASELLGPDPMYSGQFVRGIPSPGVPTFNIPPVIGIANCSNLLIDSPPTLLEEYDLAQYAIAYTVFLESGSAWGTPPTATAELGVLVNDRLVYVTTNGPETTVVLPPATGTAVVANVWTSDFNNPIGLGARDRLSIRAGFGFDGDQETEVAAILVGIQLTVSSTGSWIIGPGESSLTYDTVAVPAARKL